MSATLASIAVCAYSDATWDRNANEGKLDTKLIILTTTVLSTNTTLDVPTLAHSNSLSDPLSYHDATICMGAIVRNATMRTCMTEIS